MRVVNLRDYPREQVRYIGRGSKLGNPFTNLPLHTTKALVQCDSIESAVGCFEAWMRGATIWDPAMLRAKALAALWDLHEDDLLGCYCTDLVKCHGQVVVKLWKELHHNGR